MNNTSKKNRYLFALIAKALVALPVMPFNICIFCMYEPKHPKTKHLTKL
jgi:hypothetical protein